MRPSWSSNWLDSRSKFSSPLASRIWICSNWTEHQAIQGISRAVSRASRIVDGSTGGQRTFRCRSDREPPIETNEPLALNRPMTTIEGYERIRNGEARRCFGPRAVHQWLRRHVGREVSRLLQAPRAGPALCRASQRRTHPRRLTYWQLSQDSGFSRSQAASITSSAPSPQSISSASGTS